MVERLSSMKSKLIPGHFGASGVAGVVLGERPVAILQQVAGWQGFEDVAAPMLADLGLTGLGGYRSAQVVKGCTAWRTAPDKVLIEGAKDLSPYANDELVTLDLSHARTAITLRGANARDVLAQVIAIDTSPQAFTVGDFLQTGIHHVGVLIHCTAADSFEILTPVTWAETLWEVLEHNAAPFGYEISKDAA